MEALTMKKSTILILKILKLVVFLCGFPLMALLVYMASAKSIAEAQGYELMKPWEVFTKSEIRDAGAFDMDLPWPWLGILVLALLLVLYVVIYLVSGSRSKRKRLTRRKSAIRYWTAMLMVLSVGLSATVWFVIDRALPGILEGATQGTITYAEIANDPKGIATRHAELLNKFIVMNVEAGNLGKEEVDEKTDEYYFQIEEDKYKALIELSGWSASASVEEVSNPNNYYIASRSEVEYSKGLRNSIITVVGMKAAEIDIKLQNKPMSFPATFREYLKESTTLKNASEEVLNRCMYVYFTDDYKADLAMVLVTNKLYKFGMTKWEALTYLAKQKAVAEVSKKYVSEGIKNEQVKKLIKAQYNSINDDAYTNYRGPLVDFANGGRLTIPVLIHLLLDDKHPSVAPFYVGGEAQWEGTNWVVLDLTPDPISMGLPMDIQSLIAEFLPEYAGTLALIFFDPVALVQSELLPSILSLIGDKNVLGAPIYLSLQSTNEDGKLFINSISVYDPDFKLIANKILDDEDFSYTSAYLIKNGFFVGDPDLLGLGLGESTIALKLIPSGAASKGTLDYMAMAWLDSNALLVGIISLFHLRNILFAYSAVLVLIAMLTGLLRYAHYGTGAYEKYKEEKKNKRAAKKAGVPYVAPNSTPPQAQVMAAVPRQAQQYGAYYGAPNYYYPPQQ